MKSRKNTYGKAASATAAHKSRPRKRRALTLSTPVDASQLHTMKIGDFYKPLKKPVTLRLDADLIAWFKKDGRKYQTRINKALRIVMEREMKTAGA